MNDLYGQSFYQEQDSFQLPDSEQWETDSSHWSENGESGTDFATPENQMEYDSEGQGETIADTFDYQPDEPWSNTGYELWQVSTGRLICNLIGHNNHVNSLAFYPYGTILAGGSDDDKSIKLWQMKELQ